MVFKRTNMLFAVRIVSKLLAKRLERLKKPPSGARDNLDGGG